MYKKRIGVIYGGRSGEHEVSLASAHSVVENLDRDKYEVIPIAISKDGVWHWGVEPRHMLAEANDPARAKALAEAPLVSLTTNATSRALISLNEEHVDMMNGRIDVLFPILHGPYGEDGTIQGLFEMANISYVGCGVLGSAVGMDKEIMKALFQAVGLPIVDMLVYRRHQWRNQREEILATLEQRLTYPCFVKPANLGSSIGVNKARDRNELVKAIEEAFTYDRKILIEQGLTCREFSCGVLGNEDPLVSQVGEILPGDDYSDYADKYVNHTIQFAIPAEISHETVKELQTIALQAYQALDLSGLARVDFFQDIASGKFYINEVNTLPGFTSQSLYPKLWAASGLSYPALLDRLIELAEERYQEQQSRHASR